ncbi:HERV-H LTR-associating protein 2 [Bagarius yarrelli]|uniref:HERV-H LTR-associating protein 2 n=1 Tax=Bagarius yarrelli TaxID=175774 RepID=A0A556TU04_BAGYA|nr:HERV-H LTR-associating protein 2 [Bagarius yarrelli]
MLLAANVSGILFLLLVRNVSVESVSVTAAVGDTVVLPCQINSNPEDVYWRYSDVRNVCNIIKGKADFNGQDPAFKDRVNIFPLEIKNGNFSIRLDKVSKSDEGPYICSAPSISLRENLELKVTATAEKVCVYAVINDSAVLPCEFKQNSQMVFWPYRDRRTVCDVINGAVDFDEQDPAYRDRV